MYNNNDLAKYHGCYEVYRCFKMFSRQLSPVQQKRRPCKIRQNRNILALCITKTMSLFSLLPYYVFVIYKPECPNRIHGKFPEPSL